MPRRSRLSAKRWPRWLKKTPMPSWIFSTSSSADAKASAVRRDLPARWASPGPAMIENRWQEVVVAAFGDDDRARTWWEWLAEVRPETPNSERLNAMLALFRMGTDPGRLAEKWLGLLWQSVDALPPAERQALVERIYELSAETGDVVNCLKAWDQLPPAGRDKIFWGLQIVHLSAVERWDDAVRFDSQTNRSHHRGGSGARCRSLRLRRVRPACRRPH
jgi:hypothetical protein